MSDAENEYHRIATLIDNSVKSHIFGTPCYKVGGKAFCAFFNDSMVFKLEGEAHAMALGLNGAMLFDPSGKGLAMKAWVVVTYESKDSWFELANVASEFIRSST